MFVPEELEAAVTERTAAEKFTKRSSFETLQ